MGEIISSRSRGTLMGNRGCLHDEGGSILRSHRGKRWILCLLSFKGRRRILMSPGRYTELFFLDEATGFAAGHRPCAECQRERFIWFLECWAHANPELVGKKRPSARLLDEVMHQERLAGKARRVHVMKLSELPVGAMILRNQVENPYLVGPDSLVAWSFTGYGIPEWRRQEESVGVLTPVSVVRAMRAGYQVQIHDSAGWSG